MMAKVMFQERYETSLRRFNFEFVTLATSRWIKKQYTFQSQWKGEIPMVKVVLAMVLVIICRLLQTLILERIVVLFSCTSQNAIDCSRGSTTQGSII